MKSATCKRHADTIDRLGGPNMPAHTLRRKRLRSCYMALKLMRGCNGFKADPGAVATIRIAINKARNFQLV